MYRIDVKCLLRISRMHVRMVKTNHLFKHKFDKTYNKTCVTSNDSDKPVHPPV